MICQYQRKSPDSGQMSVTIGMGPRSHSRYHMVLDRHRPRLKSSWRVYVYNVLQNGGPKYFDRRLGSMHPVSSDRDRASSSPLVPLDWRDGVAGSAAPVRRLFAIFAFLRSDALGCRPAN
eukprot:scaffold1672_cov234-Pinguiococcus_pyrenoidosus.AAC.1